MSDYRVDIDEIRRASQELQIKGERIAAIEAEASASLATSAAYNGELQARVRKAASGAVGPGTSLMLRAANLSSELKRRAGMFEAVFENSVAVMTHISNQMNEVRSRSRFMDFFARIAPIQFAGADFVFLIGGFVSTFIRWVTFVPPPFSEPTILPNRTPLSRPRTVPIIKTYIPKGTTVTDKSGRKWEVQDNTFIVDLDQRRIDNGITMRKVRINGDEAWVQSQFVNRITVYSHRTRITGSDVIADDAADPNWVAWGQDLNRPEQYHPRYLRYAISGGDKANCTWYVARAVESESGGTIKLIDHNQFDPGWGDAEQWPDRARKYLDDHPDGHVERLSGVPRPGSAYVDVEVEGNHVMFVEETRLIEFSDGSRKWEIVISEENWGGGERIPLPGDPVVNRTKRTLLRDIKPGSPDNEVQSGEFIHFRYETQ